MYWSGCRVISAKRVVHGSFIKMKPKTATKASLDPEPCPSSAKLTLA